MQAKALVIIVLITLLLGMESASARTVSRVPLQRLQSHCLSHDFSKVTCQATPANSPEYQDADSFQNRFKHVAARILVRTFVWHLPPPGGDRLVADFHQQLKNYAATKQLNTCQRMALTACAVNQIIEYDDALNDPKEFWQRLLVGLVYPDEFYYSASSRGICTEFCALYAQVGRVLGLQVQELANGVHCFNRVRQGGEWVYVEPQEGGRQPSYLNSNSFHLLAL